MKKLYIPPTLMAYCIVAMILLYFLAPGFNLIPLPYNLVGLPIAFAGLILMGKARDLFTKYKTTHKIESSSHLIKEGVFLKSRNPMYLGMVILVLGFSITSTNVLTLSLPFIFLYLVRILFIAKEERMLTDTFGQDYLEYKKSVSRFINML